MPEFTPTDSGTTPTPPLRAALGEYDTGWHDHDISSGAAIEYGAAHRATPKPVRNTIYLLAVNLTEVAKTQTGGNGIQFWGVDGQAAEIEFIQVDNAKGYALWDGGMNSRAVPVGKSPAANQVPWRGSYQ